MCRDHVNVAIIVTGILFGVGHIVNLFNGRGTELAANLCQVVYAAAIVMVITALAYAVILWRKLPSTRRFTHRT